MEPAGPAHRCSVHSRYLLRQTQVQGHNTSKPDDSSRDESPEDRSCPQAAEDGEGHSLLARHGYPGFAAGRQSRPLVLLAVLYICYARSGTLRQTE